MRAPARHRHGQLRRLQRRLLDQPRADADVRRGRKAVHSQWGNDVTVLAGDFLYIKSMAMALSQDTLDIVRMLCDVTLRMIEGEIYQLTKNGVVDLTEDEHFEIIRRKTAYLFGGCAQIGGILGEVSEEKQQALREYGFSLGIMFQLVDDLLDFTGAAEALGKPVGGDLREGKITLPLIHLLNHGGREANDLIRNAVRDRDISAENWARLKALLTEHRSIEYAYNRYSNEAKRLYGVMNKQVTAHKYIAGNQYSIADMAIFPWLRSWKNQGIDWADYPALKDWYDRIEARPAVQRGVQVLTALRQPLMDDKARDVLFGQTQYKAR